MKHDHIGEIRQTLTSIWTERLYREYENICFHFSLKLKKPLIQIKDLKSKWGEWDPSQRLITLSLQLIAQHAWDVVLEIFKHEIAHQIVQEMFRLPDHTHGEPFQNACQMLGLSQWAARAGGDLEQDFVTADTYVLSAEEAKQLQRVEKLLALATSSNEHEALLAMRKVRELSGKYHLEQLKLKQRPQHTYIIINSGKRRLAPHYAGIAGILTDHFLVEVIFSSLYNAKACVEHKTLEILGTHANVQMAEYVYHFLQKNLNQLWEQYRNRTGVDASSKNSYYLGILAGFSEKLAQQKTNNMATVSTEQGLVVAAEQRLLKKAKHDLNAYVGFRHPRLTTRRWSRSTRDQASYAVGKRDGNRLTLNRPITSRGTGNIRLLNP